MLNTLDLLKKGTSSLAQRARAASRILEAQVGTNPRVRVQRDEAFVYWDKIASTSQDTGTPLPSPEWVRRTVCCAKWETDNPLMELGTDVTPKSTPRVVFAVLSPSSQKHSSYTLARRITHLPSISTLLLQTSTSRLVSCYCPAHPSTLSACCRISTKTPAHKFAFILNELPRWGLRFLEYVRSSTSVCAEDVLRNEYPTGLVNRLHTLDSSIHRRPRRNREGNQNSNPFSIADDPEWELTETEHLLYS